MIDIKTNLISLFPSDVIKSYYATTNALEQIEVVVFSNYALLLGDLVVNKSLLSNGFDRVEYLQDIIYITKNNTSIPSELDTITHTLRLSRTLGGIKTEVTTISELTKITDKIYYCIIQLRVIDIQAV